MTDSDHIEIEITLEDRKRFKRLDLLLVDKIHSLSRSGLKKLYLQGLIVSVPSIPLVFDKMPPPGTLIYVSLPSPLPMEIRPENIPLDIVYEDDYLLFINKPAGMVVHPAPGNLTGTLLNGVLYHCPGLEAVGDSVRPGIVHRIDKGTTGILVVAKEQKCYEKLLVLFGTHRIDRAYQALVHGSSIPPSGKLKCTMGRNPYNRLKMKANVVGGKDAISNYQVKEFFLQTAHLELTLETGRTHQIRVQLSSLLGTPILGDSLYGKKRQPLSPALDNLLRSHSHPLLHARRLGFVHPMTQKKICLEVEPHEAFTQVLEFLRKEKRNRC